LVRALKAATKEISFQIGEISNTGGAKVPLSENKKKRTHEKEIAERRNGSERHKKKARVLGKLDEHQQAAAPKQFREGGRGKNTCAWLSQTSVVLPEPRKAAAKGKAPGKQNGGEKVRQGGEDENPAGGAAQRARR